MSTGLIVVLGFNSDWIEINANRIPQRTDSGYDAGTTERIKNNIPDIGEFIDEM